MRSEPRKIMSAVHGKQSHIMVSTKRIRNKQIFGTTLYFWHANFIYFWQCLYNSGFYRFLAVFIQFWLLYISGTILQISVYRFLAPFYRFRTPLSQIFGTILQLFGKPYITICTHYVMYVGQHNNNHGSRFSDNS